MERDKIMNVYVSLAAFRDFPRVTRSRAHPYKDCRSLLSWNKMRAADHRIQNSLCNCENKLREVIDKMKSR